MGTPISLHSRKPANQFMKATLWISSASHLQQGRRLMSKPRLTIAAKRQLQADLGGCVAVIKDAYLAWERGVFCSLHLADVIRARDMLAAGIAKYDDARAAVIPDETLDGMRYWEDLAADLLDGVTALNEASKEERVKTPTGSWAITRRILISGKAYEQFYIAANPAVASKYLDEWETTMRRGIA